MSQDEASLAGSDEASAVSRAEASPRPAGHDEAWSATDPVVDAATGDNQESESTDAPRGRDYTSAVYGSVLAATVVVSAGDLRSPAALSTLLIVSGIVFWIAHVYAATVAGRHGGWHLGSIWTGMKHEWPVAFP